MPDSRTETEQTRGVPQDCLVHDLFLRQAEREPGRTAVISANRTLSYGELRSLSQVWAGRLRQLGARPNTLVAVVMEKGWEQMVAVMATLQSGAAYLPIDVGVPTERLHYLLKNGEAQVVLTQSWVDDRLQWPAGVTRLSLDVAPPAGEEAVALPGWQTPDDLAYVLYTSGSTGAPKGVMIAHRGLVNCILDTNRTFGISAGDRALAVTALHHDMSVFDIFGLLAAGGAIVIPEHLSSRAPDHWAGLIDREGVTIWNSVPAFMEMLLQYAAGRQSRLPNRLRLAFLGGDWIAVSAPGRIRQYLGDLNVVSVGGPTETTVWNIWYPVREADPNWKSIPYGHPISNTRYYVLDESLHECPPGVEGELCCAGVGLMKGYWRDPEKTAAKLSAHPATGETICRTGDRGRLRDDGEIEFLGRMDTQVKISGQRIELGEIESVLMRHPKIKQAAVTVVPIGGQKRLAAYVATQDTMSGSPRYLQAYLRERLPCHMVPGAFVRLDSLPLNSNGKIDRNALPLPDSWYQEPARTVSAPAESSPRVEDLICAAWRKVLGVERIAPSDNFFDLGGDSLLLVAVHAELRRTLRRELAVTTLFQFPSVRSLTEHLEAAAAPVFSDIEIRAQKQRTALAQRRNMTRPS